MASKKPSATRSTPKTSTKKSAASRSPAKAKPTDTPPDPHQDYDFEVYVDMDNHVRIHGTNQGNIRGSRGDAIRFSYVGHQLDPGFTITATEFKKNKEKAASQKKKWRRSVVALISVIFSFSRSLLQRSPGRNSVLDPRHMLNPYAEIGRSGQNGQYSYQIDEDRRKASKAESESQLGQHDANESDLQRRVRL